MKYLLKYLKGYHKEAVVAPLFKMLEACFELLVPLVTAGIIDYGIKYGDISYIWKRCFLLIGLGIIGLICALTAQFYAARASMGFGANVRSALFKHINKLNHEELDKVGTSTLITRITGDVNQLQTGVNLFLRLFMRSPFIAAGAVVMSFLISPAMTVIFLAAMLMISIVIYIIIKVTVPIYKKVQSYLDKVVLHTRENFSGVRVIRAFNGQAEEENEFLNSNEKLKKTQVMVGRISGLMNPGTFVLANLGIIAVIYTGGKTVYSGAVSQGEIVALINYMTQILQALLVLANLIITVSKAAAGSVRVKELLLVKTRMKEGKAKPGLPIGDIEFKNVTFSYNTGEEPVISGISFKAEKGMTLGVIGGTGSGKSTLVNLITRFYDVNQGEILLNNRVLSDYTYESIRKRIGLVPQKSVLFSGTIRDNMKWRDAEASDNEIIRALTTAQAKRFVFEKEGLDTCVLQNGSNFSGGQKQRLCIARALVGAPDILILDDSASALDYGTEFALKRALDADKDNRITFLVSQRISTVRHADIILVIDDGRLAGKGTHDDLINTCSIYKEIYSSQIHDEEVMHRA